MRYLFAILLPPLAVWSCGKFFSAILNLILCCFFVVPGIVHAVLVVNKYYSDQRMKQFLKAAGR